MQSTTNKHSELLQSQMNVKEMDNKNSSKLIEREHIPGTPFHVIGMKDKGWFLIMGNYKITEDYATKDEAINQLAESHWNIILNLTSIAVETINKIKHDNTTKNTALQ